ncbi:hypothetical protein ABK040_011151 [Willaertia magna]
MSTSSAPKRGEILKALKPDNEDAKEYYTNARVEIDEETGEPVVVVSGYKFKEKDRTKRLVKVPGDVDRSNIIRGTRRRTNINYNEKALQNGKIESRTHTSSKNTLETRAKTKVVKSTKSTSSTTTKSKRVVKHETEEKENNDNMDVDEEEELQTKTKARSRKQKEEKKVETEMNDEEEDNAKPKEQWNYPLCKEVCQQIERLGGTIVQQAKKIRYQKKHLIPDEIYLFANAFKKETPQQYSITINGQSYNGITFEIFALEEDDNIDWVDQNKEEAILLGDGDAIIAARLTQANEDFTIYIIDDNTNPSTVHEMPLSQFLQQLEIDQN